MELRIPCSGSTKWRGYFKIGHANQTFDLGALASKSGRQARMSSSPVNNHCQVLRACCIGIAMVVQGVLIDHHRSKCKDPRDRVFALLGLIPPGEREILSRFFPDYSITEDYVLIITLAHLTQSPALSRMLRSGVNITPDSEELFSGLGVGPKSQRRRLLRRAEKPHRWRKPHPLPSTYSYGSEASPGQYRNPSSICPQPRVFGRQSTIHDEDCLQSNIWIPLGKPPDGGWPVFFYIRE